MRAEMKIGYLGLGKMGKNMVLRLLEQGISVVAWNRSQVPLEQVVQAGAQGADSPEEVVKSLQSPRVVWIMLPQGELIDQIINTLVPHLTEGDLVIDGGNSFYKDSVRRAKQLEQKRIHFMDIGVSGGPSGARHGACLMIGGEVSDYQRIEPLVKALAATDAYRHLGPVGAGHFAKMVHNGIEYGMMQAIAEGAAVLHSSPFHFDLKQVFDIYNRQSVIESRLIGWATQAFQIDQNLSDVSSSIGHTGEGQWMVDAARELGVNIPVIEQSLQIRLRSADEPENWRNKVVSALRGQFGGHSIQK